MYHVSSKSINNRTGRTDILSNVLIYAYKDRHVRYVMLAGQIRLINSCPVSLYYDID